MDRIVFLDRDGTINVEKNYLFRKEDFQFIPGAIEAIRLLNRNNYKVIVVTNQAGIARGYYTEEDVIKLHQYINTVLSKYDAYIDSFFYCPHHPSNGIGDYKVECHCRKPNTGLFRQSEVLYQVDKGRSWMIGDNISDIQAGLNYQIRTILVSTGYGHSVYDELSGKIGVEYYAIDILDAVTYILKSGDIQFKE